MEESAIPPLLGIIGNPIAGNPMQFAMEQALAAAQLDWRFLSFDVPPDRLAASIAGVDALGFRGLAIAPPYGPAVLELVERRSDTARVTGWVDALSRDSDESLVVHHLAGDSLVQLLGHERIEGATIGMVGDAPESVAVVASLIPHNPHALLLRDADPECFAEAVRRANASAPPRVRTWSGNDAALEEMRVLIRAAAPAEKAGEAAFTEHQIERLHDRCVVVDLAVCASTSPLLRTAAARELTIYSRIDLLVAQAELAFNQWTGHPADTTTLREAFEEYLEI